MKRKKKKKKKKKQKKKKKKKNNNKKQKRKKKKKKTNKKKKKKKTKKKTDVVVVVVRIFNATRHPGHIEAAAIAMMCMYLYSLAFMDHQCTLGAAVCHQAPPCPLNTQPRARRV